MSLAYFISNSDKKPDPTTMNSMEKILHSRFFAGIEFKAKASTKGEKIGCIEIISTKKELLGEKYFKLKGYVQIAEHSEEDNLVKRGYIKYSEMSEDKDSYLLKEDAQKMDYEYNEARGEMCGD